MTRRTRPLGMMKTVAWGSVLFTTMCPVVGGTVLKGSRAGPGGSMGV